MLWVPTRAQAIKLPKPNHFQTALLQLERAQPQPAGQNWGPTPPPLVWWLPGTSEGNASPLPWGSDLLWVPTRAQAIKLPKPNHFQTALLQLERAQPQPAGQNWGPTPPPPSVVAARHL